MDRWQIYILLANWSWLGNGLTSDIHWIAAKLALD